MIDQEKVIKGLELCRYDPDPGMPLKSEVSCDICPYWDDTYGCRMNDMFDDAIALLKAQEPRVLTPEEMQAAAKNRDAVYVEESPEGSYARCFWGLVVDGIEPPKDGGYNYPGGVLFNVVDASDNMWDGDLYGLKTPLGWRCWDKRPTEEQREATPWNQ